MELTPSDCSVLEYSVEKAGGGRAREDKAGRQKSLSVLSPHHSEHKGKKVVELLETRHWQVWGAVKLSLRKCSQLQKRMCQRYIGSYWTFMTINLAP